MSLLTNIGVIHLNLRSSSTLTAVLRETIRGILLLIVSKAILFPETGLFLNRRA